MKNENRQDKPWYRYPWPWVAIAIPGAAVIMGITTLVLALQNPDPLVIDKTTYRDISSDLKAQNSAEADKPEPAGASGQDDGDH